MLPVSPDEERRQGNVEVTGPRSQDSQSLAKLRFESRELSPEQNVTVLLHLVSVLIHP